MVTSKPTPGAGPVSPASSPWIPKPSSAERWAAIAAIGSAASALVAAIGYFVATDSLRASQDSVRATLLGTTTTVRGQMLKDVDAAVVRLTNDRKDAPYFFLVLKAFADYRQSNVLTKYDVDFIANYLSEQSVLCRHRELISEWNRLKSANLATPELAALVEPLIGDQRKCAEGDGK